MERLHSLREIGLALLAGLLVAAAVSVTASFRAPARDADLEPVGDAGSLVQILQGNNSILWSTMSGNVTSYVIQGWPTETEDAELGGAMVIERPDDGQAGTIDLGSKPMSLQFELDR